MGKVIKFPGTRGDKSRKEMCEQLRFYADLIENDCADPPVEMFVIALKQGKKFVIGGCGKITPHEQAVLRLEFIKYLRSLGGIIC